VVRTRAIWLIGLAAIAAGCGTALPAASAGTPTAPSATLAVPTPTTSPAPPTIDPNAGATVIEAFRKVVASPTFAGSGGITGMQSASGTLPALELSGSIAWQGADVVQSIGKTIGGRARSAAKSATIGGRTYLFACAPPSCLAVDYGLWTLVPDDTPGPYSVIDLLRSDLDLRYDGASTLDGAPVERLVAALTAAEAPALGMVGAFGQRSFREGLTGELAVLVEPGGRPIRIDAATTLDLFGQKTETSMTLDLTDQVGSPPAAPAAANTLAYVTTKHGYRIAVPMDWSYVAGSVGGVDRFVAPKGAPRQELRIRLELIPIAEFTPGVADGDLGQRLDEEYEVTGGSGGYGGFMGAINLTAVAIEATIEGKATNIDAGPIFWQEYCPDAGATCGEFWSIMELWTDPDAWFEPPGPSPGITLFELAETFRNDVPPPGSA
jgi:hypothetical protein